MPFPFVPRGGLPFALRQGSQNNDGQVAPQLRSPLVFNAPIAGRISAPDYIPNLLLALLIPAPFSQLDWTPAPQIKAPVVASQHINTVLLGINPQSSLSDIPGLQSANVEIQRSAPAIRYQLRIDPIPNLIGTTLVNSSTRPFSGLVEPDSPTVNAYTTADMYVVSYIPTQVETITTRPALMMPVPQIKAQVFSEPQPNILIHGIPAVAATRPFAVQQDTSQLQKKSDVYDLNSLWPNSRLPNGPPVAVQNPFAGYFFTQQQVKGEVYDLNYLWPNSQLPNTIPAVIPPPVTSGQGNTIAGGRVILDPKKQCETIPGNFNFISCLGTNETLVSAVTTCSVYLGTDPNPSVLIDGGTSISGTIATQGVTGGIVGVIYELLCAATTSLGNVIEISAFLAIEPDLPG